MLGIYKKIKEQGALLIIKRLFKHLQFFLFLPYTILERERIRKAASMASLEIRNKNLVVFVCTQLHLRAIKIAYSLKLSGWKVVLLYKDDIAYDIVDYFSDSHRFQDSWEALQLASNYRPVAYHVFSNYHFELAALFVKYKPGKIVFDNYDLLTGMFKKKDLIPKFLKEEQYCYINADGICSRDLRVNYLIHALKFKLPKRILFSEYGWPKEKLDHTKKLTDGIHIVYVGSIATDPKSIEAYEYELGALLSSNSIHFHIYPSHSNSVEVIKENMKDFVAKDLLEKYIHIHDTISPLDVNREISKYHYGLIISTKNVDFGNYSETYFQQMGDYLLPSKLFDYLNAGLFILSQNAKYIRFIIERYEIGKVVRSLGDIVETCKTTPKQVNMPDSLIVNNNVRRLIDFYSNL